MTLNQFNEELNFVLDRALFPQSVDEAIRDESNISAELGLDEDSSEIIGDDGAEQSLYSACMHTCDPGAHGIDDLGEVYFVYQLVGAHL